MKGKLYDSVPRPNLAKDGIDWDSKALLARENPGQGVLAGKDMPESRARSLRVRNREPFVTDEGRIVVSVRDSYLTATGRRYGNIWFEWVPTPKEGNP